MSIIAASPDSPRPVSVISTEVYSSAGTYDSKGGEDSAVKIPMATFIAEKDIEGGVVAFPRKLLTLLLVSDGVAVFAPIALILMSSIAEMAEDYNTPNPVIALISLLSGIMSILLSISTIFGPVLACAMHSKTSKEEHKPSTKQILRIHVAIFISDIVATHSYVTLFLMLMARAMITYVLAVLALIALRIACFLLVIKLHKKIKTSDKDAVKYAVAQSLIEKDGIEIV